MLGSLRARREGPTGGGLLSSRDPRIGADQAALNALHNGSPPALITIWPRWQRALHWALAGSVLTAVLTHKGDRVHEWTGYAALLLACVRVVLGFAGPAVGRFRSFILRPSAAWAYARQVMRHNEARYLNHNPLGGWMILLLLCLSVLGGASGALYVTDRYWGEARVIGLHAILSWAIAPLAALHVLGVVSAGRRHGENLIAAMWRGRKRVLIDPEHTTQK